MTRGVFKITDGTYQVDLLKLREGVSAQDWRQAVASYKDSGVWQQSSLSDGRRLVDKKFTNATESIHIPAIGGDGRSQNVTISILHRLFALTQKASDYWVSSWQDEPVWLEVRAECETNSRYAVVSTANIPAIADIFQPGAFANNAALTDMTLIIERDHWTENEPGTGTAVEISAVEAYNAINYGNVDSTGTRVPTTTNKVYFANRRNMANITHIFTWSAANGFGANLVGGAVPFDLIDDVGAAPQVNDYVAFGINTALANSGPFLSLVFDIGTASAGFTFVWEIWNNFLMSWDPIAVIQDNTDTGGAAFDTTGINSMAFDWIPFVATAINGVTAYWIRLRVSAAVATTTPTQQNRNVYAVVWPYVELEQLQVGGDLPALAKLKVYPQSDFDSNRRIIAGLRSESRGANFTAYLNCSDEQNPPGVTVAITGTFTAFNASGYSFATDRVVRFNPPANDAMASRFTITIAAPLTAHFYGQFHGFLRTTRTGVGIGEYTIEVETTVSSGGNSIIGPQTVSTVTASQLMDLGVINLPFSELLQSEIVDEIVFDVRVGYVGTGGETLYFGDLILMPVDEWACDTSDFVLSATSISEVGEVVLIDSITYPKKQLRSHIANISTGYIKTIWGTVKNGPAILQCDAKQRLWFTMAEYVAPDWAWSVSQLMSIQVEKQQRYLGPRGNV